MAILFFALALAESRLKSPTSDEPPHLASGLSYVATGILRGNPEHPPLLKELSGISLLAGGIRWPRTKDADALLYGERPPGAQPEWEIGYKLIADNGPDRVMFWARLPFLVIAALLAVLIFTWGRDVVGAVPALCAVFLFVTDPTILGHSFLVTTDLGVTAFEVLLLFALWHYVKEPTAWRLLVCGLALGAVLCAKFSAVFLLPVVALLLFTATIWPPEFKAGRTRTFLDPYYVEAGSVSRMPIFKGRPTAGRNDPCPCGSGKKYKACHGRPEAAGQSYSGLLGSWVRCMGVFLIMCAVAAFVVEAIYLFSSDPLLYVRGVNIVNSNHSPRFFSYLGGELQHRFTGYFAIAYLLKEPIANIVLVGAGFVLLLRSKSIAPLGKAFILLPAAVMFAAPSLLADEVGIRYIMPVFPFAHLLGGLGLAALFTMKAKWGRWAAGGCCAWLLLALAGIYPDHIAYFNESACLLTDPAKVGIDGGSKCGVNWLDDSNTDWGQNLRQLSIWLDGHAKGRTIRYASVYGFPPSAYGIPYEKLAVWEMEHPPRKVFMSLAQPMCHEFRQPSGQTIG